MPNILVYCALPVFLFVIQVAYSSSSTDTGVRSDFSDLSGESSHKDGVVHRRNNERRPKTYQISLIFLIDMQESMLNNFQQVRDDVRMIDSKFEKHDSTLIFEYIFVQSRFGGQ